MVTKKLSLVMLFFWANLGLSNDFFEIRHKFNNLNIETAVFDYENNTFIVDEQIVERHNIHNDLMNFNSDEMILFLQSPHTYLTASRDNHGDFHVRGSLRIRGGGPVAGLVGYWATKAIGYGATAAAVGTAVAGTGGAIAGGAAAGAVGAGVAGGVAGGAAAGAAGAATSVGLTASAAAGGLAAVEAAGGIVVGIETASTSVGAALTAIPFLP